jgi:hypothetical protein
VSDISDCPHYTRALTTRRVALFVTLAALATLGTLGGVGSTASAAQAQSEKPKAQYLFVVEAQAVWTQSFPRGQIGLNLSGVDARVLYFSDRPVREAGTIPAAVLFEHWQKFGFAKVPPNAAIVAPNGPAGHRPTAVKLFDPHYDATAGALEICMCVLGHQDGRWLTQLTETTAAQHGPVSLFIDSAQVLIENGYYDFGLGTCDKGQTAPGC